MHFKLQISNAEMENCEIKNGILKCRSSLRKLFLKVEMNAVNPRFNVIQGTELKERYMRKNAKSGFIKKHCS